MGATLFGDFQDTIDDELAKLAINGGLRRADRAIIAQIAQFIPT